MQDRTETQIYESGSWLSKNVRGYEQLETILQELDTRRDSIPLTFKPKEFLQFLRGAMNEVKRVSGLNKTLIEALKFANKGAELPEDTEQLPK